MKELLAEKRGNDYILTMFGAEYRVVLPVEPVEKVAKVSKPKKKRKKTTTKK